MRRAFVLVYCRSPDSTVHLIRVLHYASSSLHRGLLKATLLGAEKKERKEFVALESVSQKDLKGNLEMRQETWSIKPGI